MMTCFVGSCISEKLAAGGTVGACDDVDGVDADDVDDVDVECIGEDDDTDAYGWADNDGSSFSSAWRCFFISSVLLRIVLMLLVEFFFRSSSIFVFRALISSFSVFVVSCKYVFESSATFWSSSYLFSASLSIDGSKHVRDESIR